MCATLRNLWGLTFRSGFGGGSSLLGFLDSRFESDLGFPQRKRILETQSRIS